MLMLAFLIKNINYFVYLWNWFEALSEDPLKILCIKFGNLYDGICLVVMLNCIRCCKQRGPTRPIELVTLFADNVPVECTFLEAKKTK